MIEAMRDEARALFQVAVEAADPGAAVRRSLSGSPVAAPGPGGYIRVVAVGKAAGAMAGAARDVLSRQGAAAEYLVITNAENAASQDGMAVHVAGHPVPDTGGLRAAEAVEAMLAEAGAQDLVLALVSGGGSALLPAPVAGVSLEDKAEASRLMLGAGLDITAMNSVRQHLSRLKGGGLLRAAAPARVVALILSDVIGDDLRVIASGQTAAPIASRAAVRRMLQDRELWDRMPKPVRAALERAEPAQPLPEAENRLIGSNAVSLQAMARDSGGAIWDASLCGDVETAAAAVAARMRAAAPGRVVALCGGETTVTLRGKGRGGRNQELALRVARHMEGVARPWVVLSGGTDGRDGPTEAAGGLVDGGTLERIAAAGGDVAALLANNDSNRALSLAGDLLITGGTGTNVADVQIVILG
ncbi:MAG: hydroxypyruvate reductase TtuD [Rhodobacteraceae bacterium HLUCCA12]|nr:MAG: hydroxypyruvate reductase TtuD [Rhodobacteraceae bacterium HLUCCA12]